MLRKINHSLYHVYLYARMMGKKLKVCVEIGKGEENRFSTIEIA
jgi:hypothetical protein